MFQNNAFRKIPGNYTIEHSTYLFFFRSSIFFGDNISIFKIQKSRTAEKSEDELRKFSIDPNLSPLDRNLKLLNGNDIQKSVACRSLVFLIDQIPQNEMNQILDGVKVALEASKDNHQVRDPWTSRKSSWR